MRRWILPYFFLFFFFIDIASAQFYYFGQNKVQYTDFDWHVLKTEHFDIYYYPEMKDLAERGASFAEASYRLLQDKFNINVANRIPLIFYSSHLHFEQTNVTPGFIPEGVGGFFEFLKGRVVIPCDGSISQFKHVIRHELVHVFMQTKVNRVLLDHRISQDRVPPLWFTEGLAEYWSTEWDAQAEMLLRDAVLSEYLVPILDIESIYGSFLMYKEGQSFLQFLAQTYGEDKILLIMENFWKTGSFRDVMKMTFGKEYRELDQEWIYSLKKKYYPLLSNFDQPSVVSQPVVIEGFNSKPVFYRRDGKAEVFFIGNYTGYTSIYRKELENREARPVTVIEGEKSDEFEAFHIFQSKIDISKDGMLAFVTKSGENDALHLYNVNDGKIVETLHPPGIVSIGSPSWSPDGKQLAFSAIDMSGYNDLYIFSPETKSLQRLTNDYYDDRDPSWSPTGDKIAFSSDRTSFGAKGKYNLFLYDVKSKKVDYLTAGDEDYHSPSWSPDGRWIAFTSDLDGAQNIWLIDFSDTSAAFKVTKPFEMRKLTNFTTAAFDPRWTDKGGLVFTAFEKFSFQIRMIDSVQARFDRSLVVHRIDSLPRESQWSTGKIEGISEVNELKYVRDYTLDIAQSQVATDPVFGTYGGAELALSDLLGNDQYYFLIYNTAQSKDEILQSFNIAISRISLGQRLNYAYGIFHFSGRRYDLTDPDLFFTERVFGGYFALSYPFSKFYRIEATTSLSHSDKEVVTSRKALLFSNSLSFVHDNSLWASSGPIDGDRFILTLAYTTDVQYSNVDYYTVIADYRRYFRLSQRSALAVRGQVFYNEGQEARRFFMGGSWDLRGYPRWSLRGKKLWLTSAELRFPFIDQLGVKFPFGGVGLGSLRGALFFDAGSVWDDVYTETLGSIGFGLRWNLGDVLVLRYDLGKRIEDNFSHLQKGLFTQFFFGWDF
ncbi:MAG: BamA/TamA family outer membrane protein [Bacteroidota bacterium]